MFKKIDHIGIAVKDLESANEMFAALSETGLLKIEKVESEGVVTSFFRIGETKVEFLQAEGVEDGSRKTEEKNAIAKFIENHGEGMHHIAFEVEDIEKEMERLKKSGFEFVSTEPKKGADNKLICFLHPKSTNKVLIELCQTVVN
jgi:methylmalonyl-CoA/ethylmalonyl-CoA epimerase